MASLVIANVNTGLKWINVSSYPSVPQRKSYAPSSPGSRLAQQPLKLLFSNPPLLFFLSNPSPISMFTSIDGGRSPTKVNMLEVMTLLAAAWECVSPITLVNCFRKASISSKSQAQGQSDGDDPFKLLAAQLEEFQNRRDSPIDFTVDGDVDADEDVVTSEAHLLTDSEIIARVTQTQLDRAEHDDENEEDDVDREMLPPKRDQVRQAIEILQSCCLYQDDGEQKMRKKVAEIEKLYEISLLKQKQQSLITDYFNF